MVTLRATLGSVLKAMNGAPGRQSSPFSPSSVDQARSTPSRSREELMYGMLSLNTWGGGESGICVG